jgi:hypothetical protein
MSFVQPDHDLGARGARGQRASRIEVLANGEAAGISEVTARALLRTHPVVSKNGKCHVPQ